MGVDRALGGFERRHAVVIVQRVEQLEMQHGVAAQAHRLSVDGVFEGLGPAAGRGDGLHAVGPERIEFARGSIDLGLLDIGIARDQQEAIDHLEEFAARLSGIGPGQQRQQRMIRHLALALVGQPGDRGRRLGDHPHGAITDRIAGKPLLRQRRIIARRPLRPPRRVKGDEWRRGGTLMFETEHMQESIDHGIPSLLDPIA